MQGEKAFKEKYVSICEEVFSGRGVLRSARDQGIIGRTALTRFWDELLLLKVNQKFLAQCISSRTEEDLRQDLKPVINEFFSACLTYLGDENYIRVAHALESLVILCREIFRKRFSQQGVTITVLLAGSTDNADSFFKRLISSVGSLLTSDSVPVLVKSLGLRLFLTILTATDNVNSNPITSYFISNDVLDPLVCLLSVKVAADRKRLEVDAVLVLLLLLLWRESENVYVSRLASATAPLQPLLNTLASLFSPSSAASAEVDSSPSGWEIESVIGYFSSFLGLAGSNHSTNSIISDSNEESCRRSCGLMLLYYLVNHNPAFKSNQIWPSATEYNPDPAPVAVQSSSTLWINSVLKLFMDLCHTDFLVGIKSKSLQAKLALTVLRCLLECPAAADYLWHCDSNLVLRKPAGNAASTVIPFKSLACIIVDNAAKVLAEPSIDPDLIYRAAVLIPLALKIVKAQAWQLPSSSLDSGALWNALVGCCVRFGDLEMLEKPGGQEAAELLAGTLDWMLGVSQDMFLAAEETETLHATVMCHAKELERLTDIVSSAGSKQSLVNVSVVKFHYEVQIAALGVLGRPTFQQAMAGVKKKGLGNLKLKPRHAGPGRVFIENTTDMRLLNSLIKLVLNLQKAQMNVIPKLEHEAL